jgi:hypothetical protein
VAFPRARTYLRAGVDSGSPIRDHSDMPAFPRCAALLRNGQPCGRTIAPDSEFCVRQVGLLTTVGADNLRAGRIPKKRSLGETALHVVTEPEPEGATITTSATSPDPATIKPSLALAAAENVEQLTASLLEAAGSAIKPAWITVECSGCGERSRVDAPVPDVRACRCDRTVVTRRVGTAGDRRRGTDAPHADERRRSQGDELAGDGGAVRGDLRG